MEKDVIARIKEGRRFPSHIDSQGAGKSSSYTSVPDGFGASYKAVMRFFGAPRDFYEPYIAQYGDMFSGFLPRFGYAVFLTHPQHHKTVFLKDKTHCGFGDEGFFEPILGPNSLFVSEGAQHKRHRQLLTPPFHGERMRAYGNLMRRLTNERIDGWKDKSKILVGEETAQLALSIIIQAIFGIDDDKGAHQTAHDLLLKVLHRMGKYTLYIKELRVNFGSLTPWGRLVNALKDADAFVYNEIAARRKSNFAERSDILSLLLQAKDDEGNGLDDQEIRDELVTLLVAGHETTGTTLSWAVYWLDKSPEVRARLEDEVDALGDAATPETITKLPYLNAFCDEVLRIEPTIPETTRIVEKPLRIGGHLLPEGTVLVPSIWATHHRPDLYPEPHAFKPERFLERTYTPYEYLPFGGGVRKCIGYAFAFYEMKMVMFDFVRRARIKSVKKNVKSIRRNLSVGPSGHLPARVFHR